MAASVNPVEGACGGAGVFEHAENQRGRSGAAVVSEVVRGGWAVAGGGRRDRWSAGAAVFN